VLSSLVAFFVMRDVVLQEAFKMRRAVIGPFLADYTETECPPEAIGIFYFGQSNSSNTVKPHKTYKIMEKVVQYDWKSKKCFQFQEPLLGSMDYHGNSVTPFLARLQYEINAPIIVIPFGIPGSGIFEWAYGPPSRIIPDVLAGAKKLNMAKTFTIFIQGEKDAGERGSVVSQYRDAQYFNHVYSFSTFWDTTYDDYREGLERVQEIVSANAPDTRFGIVVTSKCLSDQAAERITSAQIDVAKDSPAFIAANLDLIPVNRKYRYNLCRLSPPGAEALANQLVQSIVSRL
jgi:hypothetical protein